MSVKKPMNIKEKLKILGIEGKATLEDVKKAYKKLAIEFHPDKNNGKDDKMKMINSVYAEVVNFFENKKNYEVKNHSMKMIKGVMMDSEAMNRNRTITRSG